MNPWISTALIFIITTLLAAMFMRTRNRNKSGLPLPPGPRGLPILGSLHKIDPNKPHKTYTELSEKYGQNGLFSIQMGSIYTIALTSYATVKEAFNKDVFSGRAPLYLIHGTAQGYGIIAAEGDRWKDQRKSMTAWMRTLGAARGTQNRSQLFSRLHASADLLESEIENETQNGDSVDLSHTIMEIIGGISQSFTYGLSLEKDDPVFKWMLSIQEEAVKLLGVAAVLNFLPFLRFVSSSLRKTSDAFYGASKQSFRLFESFINIRKNHLNETKGFEFEVDKDLLHKEIDCFFITMDGSNNNKLIFKPSSLKILEDDCIVDLFLEEQHKRRINGDVNGLDRFSDRQMIHFLLDVFSASLDTSASTLRWFIFLMALFPEEQEAVRKEIHSVCGKSKPDMLHMPSLPYTRAALCEAQRYRPVVPLGLPHGTLEDTTLAGYFVPKGTMIMPLLWIILHDPKVWGDPEVFRPSRFIGKDGNLSQPPYFIPFQIGKRMCPGDELSRMFLFILGSRLISRYQFELVEKPENTDGIFGLTLSPPDYRLKIKKLFDWS